MNQSISRNSDFALCALELHHLCISVRHKCEVIFFKLLHGLRVKIWIDCAMQIKWEDEQTENGLDHYSRDSGRT